MRSALRKDCRLLGRMGLITSVLTAAALFAQTAGDDDHFEHRFKLRSKTFANETILPLTTIDNIVQNNVNVCSVDGLPGGNQSPELSWRHAPENTRTFVVVTYDVTASFTHWGIYNIPGDATGLPENAGVAGSPHGSQIVNDFGNPEYNGPCPPPGVAPDVHRYVFTVYALDVELDLPGTANFPANAETLYHALIRAGREHHILASASLTGLYSSTPSSH